MRNSGTYQNETWLERGRLADKPANVAAAKPRATGIRIRNVWLARFAAER